MGREKRAVDAVRNDPNSEFNKHLDFVMSHQPEWKTLEGVSILQVKGSKIAATPTNGKKNGSRFIVFNVKTRKEIVQLTKQEVVGWLVNYEWNKWDF
jgi:hypothetical protein